MNRWWHVRLAISTDFRNWFSRNKVAFAAVGAVVGALVLGLAIATWQFVEKSRAEREQSRLRVQAEADKQKAQTEAAKSRQVAQFLEDMLNGVGPSVAQGLNTTLLKKVLDNTAKRVGIDLAKQPEVEAELRYTLGEVYWQLGDLSNAEAMHREALTIRTNVLGSNDAQVAQSMRRLSHVLWREGRVEEAEKMARAGIAMQRTLLGSNSLEVARSLEDLSAILNTKGTKNSLEEAETALSESLATMKAVLGHDNLEVADVLDDLAAILGRRGKGAESDAAMAEELAIRTKLLGAENPLVIIKTLSFQAIELGRQGKLPEEETKLNELVAAQRKLFGNEHPDLAQSLNRLAMLLRNEGKQAQSEAVRRDALALQRKLLGDENDEVASTLSALGGLLAEENKLSEAESVHREAMMIRRKVLGADNMLAARSLANLGEVLIKEGKLEEARSLYLEAAGGASPSAAEAQYDLGVMYRDGSGVPTDGTEAAKWFRKSAELGNRAAQCTLGSAYFHGDGVPKDELEAAKWYRKAADQGHGLAQNTLGWMYATGRGVPKDMEQSVKWLTASTDQGNMDFQTGLSQLYKSGDADEQADRVELEIYTNLLKPDWKKQLSAGQISAISDDLTKLGHLQWHLGQVLSDHHQPGEAEQLFLRALQVFETAGNAFPQEPFLRQEQAFSHRLHGDALEQLGRVSDAESDYRAAIALYAGLNATVPLNPFYRQEEGYTTWMLAEILQRAQRLDEAEAEYRKAITLHEKAQGDFPNEAAFPERLGTIKLRLAELLTQRGRLPEARPMYMEGAEHGSAEVLNEIAWVFATSADPNLRDGTNAITFAEKSVIATNRKKSMYLDTLAAAYAETGQFAKAVSIQQEAIALSQSEPEKRDLASRLKLYESNSPYRDDGALAVLANALLHEGKFAEAEGPAQECLTIREIQIPDDWRTFNARSMLGGSLLGQKRYVEAEPLLLAGYEGMKQRETNIPPEGKVRLNETLQRLAQLYDETGRPELAAESKKELAEMEKAEK